MLVNFWEKKAERSQKTDVITKPAMITNQFSDIQEDMRDCNHIDIGAI